MSSLYVKQVECSILWIKHLFQNDRLLLTCVVLLSPTSGNPDVFDSTRSPVPIPRQHVVVFHSNKHFKTVFFLRFRTPVLSLKHCSATVSPWILLVFVINPKIRRFCSLMFHRSLCCVACVVVESHSSHSFIILQGSLFNFSCVVVEFHSSHSYSSFS
jgi:hypothetical protein